MANRGYYLMSAASHLLALDWGTSSLRAALLDGQGAILAEHSSDDGILSIADRGFEAVFQARFGQWLVRWPDVVVLAAGMIGSRQGWCEAAYAACPAGFAELGEAVVWREVGGRRVGFVPGVMAEHADGSPDVIRGEEIQIFGALQALGVADGTFVLPGTHSKWVQVRDRRIVGFHTYMTGELFALLRRESILSRLMPTPGEEREWPAGREAFLSGVSRAQSGALLHDLFGIRARGLFDRLPGDMQPDYLSGLLVGEEIREALETLPGRAPESVYLVCNDALSQRYQAALGQLGIIGVRSPAGASFVGLHALAREHGWLTPARVSKIDGRK